MYKTGFVILHTFFSLLGNCACIDVHFDDATSGYFIKESDTASSDDDSRLGEGRGSSPAPSTLEIHEESKFTVLRSSQLVSLKGSYGPFLSRQTVPASHFIPDLAVNTNSSNNVLQPDSIGDLKPHLLELSAHIVTKEVRKDQPVLRVLFHSGQRGFRGQSKRNSVCIVLSAVLNNETVEGVCSPSGRDGTCLGQITIPSGWWPPLTAENGKLLKHPKIVTQVFYSVQFKKDGECTLGPSDQVTVTPIQLIGPVPLAVTQSGYQQVAQDEILHMLIPQTPLYPSSRLYVPVFVEQPQDAAPVSVIVIKCRARRGVRIEGIEETSDDWTLRIDLNGRGTIGTVTAFRKDASLLTGKKQEYSGPHEIFNWLYVIESNESELWEGGKLVWHVKYQHVEPDHLEEDIAASNYSKNARLRHRLDVKKDDVQTVLPISKRWQIMNTAVLTGRQVSQPLKIFIVSEAGKIADVTLHTSCHTNDDSALKVSSSCTSVYVDGSETRGALNAEVKVKYGTFSGQGFFTVWMAEIPLELEIPDTKLSQIKSWKVPASVEKGYQKRAAEIQNNWRDHFEEQSKKLDEKRSKLIEEIEESHECQARYQQSSVKVYARFLAEDPDSGRRDHFISRNSMLDVTDLTKRALRAADPRVVSVTGTTIQGHTIGRTEIQVLSPITGHVLGSSEVRVVKNKETIADLKVRVVSGISLVVQPDANLQNQFILQTILSEKLSTKYQEGLLDITVVFSDGTATPLRNIDPEQYYLTVDTLNSHVIAFAPVAGSKDPRVIAVGKGDGQLLQVSLELADDCHEKHDEPLATATAYVHVDFTGSPQLDLPDNQRKLNKGQRNKKKRKELKDDSSMRSVDMGDLSEIFSNIALRDDNSRVNSETVSYNAKHPPSNVYESYHHQMTPLEVGMYILLGVFCVAIAVFMASCFVYASKHNKPNYPLERKSQSIQNAHDWVWLGRQTLDKSSVATSGSRDVLDNNANSIRSRDSRGYHRDNARNYPHRFEASADINITQNPYGEYGFIKKNRQNPSNFSPDVYAELPRKRSPRPRTDTKSSHQLYQNQHHTERMLSQQSPQLSARSPFLHHLHLEPHSSPTPSTPSSIHNLEDVLSPDSCSPSPSRASSQRSRSSKPSVNSATYTRKKPVIPSHGDILPVGFPVFCSSVGDPSLPSESYFCETGFQNPWEALHLHKNHSGNQSGVGHQFFDDEEISSSAATRLHLDLTEEPPPYDYEHEQPLLRQSPASALPPYPAHENYIITPEHIRKPRGEYIPLNPDINKPNPPRLGASKVFSDPFNVSDDDAPPVPRELLSPSHIFSSVEDLHEENTCCSDKGDECKQNKSGDPESESNCESETEFSVTDFSGAEDNCSSACSVDSGELEMVDDLPDPNNIDFGKQSVSPQGSLSRRKIVNNSDMIDNTLSQLDQICDDNKKGLNTDLNSVPLGSLDYEHLMNYFETLKESSA
jgi:transmembrane protein 132